MFTWLWLYGEPTQIHSNSYKRGIPRLWTCVTHLMYRPIPPPLTHFSAITMQLSVFFLWFITFSVYLFFLICKNSFNTSFLLWTQFMLISNIISINTVVFVNQHLIFMTFPHKQFSVLLEWSFHFVYIIIYILLKRIWPRHHQLSSSQYLVSSLSVNPKYMHPPLKDLSWEMSWVIWKFLWWWGQILFYCNEKFC